MSEQLHFFAGSNCIILQQIAAAFLLSLLRHSRQPMDEQVIVSHA